MISAVQVIYLLAQLLPWLACYVSVVANVYSIATRYSKGSTVSAGCRWLTSKVSSPAVVRPRLPAPTRATEEIVDPLMKELRECAVRPVASAYEQGQRPLLTYLRDLSMAHTLTHSHCEAALQRFVEQNDMLGVQGLLMLTARTGHALTTPMLTHVLLLLCKNGGERTAVEVSRAITAQYGTDYYLEATVLEALVVAAGRNSMAKDAETLFRQLLAVGKPSVRAYGIAIHSFGSHGAVNDAVSAFEHLLARAEETQEDVSLAWNSVMAVLARNSCVQRAVSVFHRGRDLGLHILPPVALALCHLAPDEITDPNVWISLEPRKALCPKQRKALREGREGGFRQRCG